MKMKRLSTMLLTATLLVTSILVACRKQEQPDWREEVTSVLSGQTSSKSPDRPNVQSSTATTVTTDGVISDSPPSDFAPETITVITPNKSFTGENAGQKHPIINPEADVVPSISIGSSSYLLYQDMLYFPYTYSQRESLILHSVKLSDLVNSDPAAEIKMQYVPRPTSVCTDPFCMHLSYVQNNGIICPLYFQDGSADNYARTIYCIDYEASKGSFPVFYITAAEPAYTVVGNQVIQTLSEDAAIYRYDSATGKRETVVQDLPELINFFAVSDDYIYYAYANGLIALDKSGKKIGEITASSNPHYILASENGLLYISDSMGTLYTAKPDLSELTLIYSYDTSKIDAKWAGFVMSQGDIPFGYTVKDGYLYYCADFKYEATEYQEFVSSSIYRLPLNDLSASPELLVKDGCNAKDILGVVGEKVYYTPNVWHLNERNSGYQLAQGLKAVDLSTLEIITLEEDAFDMPRVKGLSHETPLITSDFLVGEQRRYTMGTPYLALYHFESGEIMYISKQQEYGIMK